MHELRKSNHSRIIICHININSVRNRFEPSNEMIKDKIDIVQMTTNKSVTF